MAWEQYASRAVRHMAVSRTARSTRVDPVSAPVANQLLLLAREVILFASEEDVEGG